MKIKTFKKHNNNKYKIVFDNEESVILYDDIIIKYNLLTNNCVQVSMRVLLQGTFASNRTKKVNMLRYLLNNGYMIPNDIYNYLNKNGFFK